MSTKCTVYIDEAGDLGINRGTQWFVLSAVIVDKDDEPMLRELLSKIKSTFNVNNIHFRKMRYEQKCFTVDTLCKGKFTYISIIIDTNKITLKATKEGDKTSFVTYNFACRMLLERASWYLRNLQKRADIVLSSRGTARDGELIDYIKNKLLTYEQNQIANVFDKVSAKPASSWDMLQLADVCATAMFYYHEPNRFGLVTPCFTYRMLPFVYSYDAYTHKAKKNYGVKYYAEDMRPTPEYFHDKILCKKA